MSDLHEMIARRARLLGGNTQLFYDEPVHIVRGEGVWLTDAAGRRYLDAYNNVAHVGHCHPRVVDALCRQARLLNTHTRYLHEAILDYGEQLTATFHGELKAVVMTCTGSEANDVALRIAEAGSGNRGFIATDATYHGNTTAVSQLSAKIPPVGGYRQNIRLVRTPDLYRAPAEARAIFTEDVRTAVTSLKQAGNGVAALILCPLLANEGQPSLETGFFDEAIRAIRDAGGYVIADEVQAGFGRSGSHFWGHQCKGFAPDIVTLGKPMGNGHPVGGVVTTEPLLSTFRKQYRYFNTFGGNPVSCVVAKTVLDVLSEEDLVANARDVGSFLCRELSRLSQRHEAIGDVRGCGLFVVAEVVRDRNTKTPDPIRAARLVNAMRERGVLIGKTGAHDNALKIRPPMTFSRENAAQLVTALDAALGDCTG